MTDHVATLDRKIPDSLVSEVASIGSRDVSEDFSIFVEELKSRFESSLDAIILYGSCLHSYEIGDGVVDFYTVVDDYSNAYQEHYLRYFNAWLPPNVFYLEVSRQEKTFRAKYAVISIADFEKGNQYWFHSYLWARFAQPVRLLYVRNEAIRQRVYYSLAHAVVAFLTPTISVLGPRVITVEEIWVMGLTLTYAAELRPEQESRACQLAKLNFDDYIKLTEYALPSLVGILEKLPEEHQGQVHYRCLTDEAERRNSLRRWRLRRWQGRVLSVLRLIKATFTFRDCIDYAAWKIERHTGIRIGDSGHTTIIKDEMAANICEITIVQN
ncbi:MAG: diacylglycerol kinase, partial [Nitrosomonadaceae bacterium]